MAGVPPSGKPDREGSEPRPSGEPLPTKSAAPERADDAIEALLGRSAGGRAASDALRALAHTARSFILYEAGNERIRNFLQETRAKMDLFLSSHGDMVIEVRPFDIVLGDEVVYSEQDRERSLAFRLYRDGVRRIAIHPGLDWNELVTLVGILSVRYKGIRTQEDDVVTLLWRAGFTHIEVAAVEGLVASEDDSQDADGGRSAAGPQNAMQAMVFAAPSTFEYPWPTFSERAVVEYRPLAAELLDRIRIENGEGAAPGECVRLARDLLQTFADPADLLALDDVVPTIREISDFLIGEQQLDALLEVARTIDRLAQPPADGRKELLTACLGEESLRRLIAAVPHEAPEAPAALVELADLAPSDLLGALLDLFGASGGQPSPAVRQLLEHRARGATQRLLERLRSADGAVAVGLLRVLVRADPDGAPAAAAALLGSGKREVQLEALAVCERAPYHAKLGRALVGALDASWPQVRSRALAILVRQHERRAFEPLLERLRRGAAAGLAEPEVGLIGEALARLDPERARPLFRDWIKPPGLLGRIAPGQGTLRWAAVAGLVHLPDGESEELLDWLSRHSGAELRQHCVAALMELRQARGERADA